jgi:dTDP-6-deoxy-L-talose 4-dehydrogenase (NAD+)
MTKKVLVTGANGFLGRQLLKSLIQADIKVCVVVRSGLSQSLRDGGFMGEIIETPDIFLESADWWVHVFKGVDVVVHSAWYLNPQNYLHSEVNLDCLAGTIVMAKAAKEAKIKKFVGIGTCLEYDLSEKYLTINTRLSPTTLYGSSKLSAYLILKSLFSTSNVEFSWCRLFSLFGDGDKESRLAGYIIRQIRDSKRVELTSGTQIRDYLDVSVAAQKIIDVALGDKRSAINICSGEGISIRKFAEKIALRYGGLELLHFGAKLDRPDEADCIVGVPN